MLRTELKWHRPNKKKPRVDKHAYYSSVRVLIEWEWKNSPGPMVSTGRYQSRHNQWIIDSSSGNIRVIRWAYITSPNYKEPITKKPKIKKGIVSPLQRLRQ